MYHHGRKTATAIAIVLPLFGMAAAPANATDLNPKEEAQLRDAGYMDWTGVYAMLFGGYGWADYDHEGEIPFGSGDYSLTLEDENWFVGAGVGGDHQVDRVVFGVVVDAAYSELGDSAEFGRDGDWSVSTDVEYFGTARGRIGYLLKDNLLAYATGGLAWAKIETSLDHDGERYDGEVASTDDSHLGWTAGGGLEWALNERVSITGEYLYLNFDEEEVSFVGGEVTYEPELDMHIVKGGVNYRF